MGSVCQRRVAASAIASPVTEIGFESSPVPGWATNLCKGTRGAEQRGEMANRLARQKACFSPGFSPYGSTAVSFSCRAKLRVLVRFVNRPALIVGRRDYQPATENQSVTRNVGVHRPPLTGEKDERKHVGRRYQIRFFNLRQICPRFQIGSSSSGS